MTVRYLWLIGIAAALLLWGCEQQPAVAPDAEDGDHVENAGEDLPAEMALAVAEAAGWTIEDRSALPAGVTEAALEKGPKFLRGWDREVIDGDIVHYRFYLQVGPGQYDVIGIHRVVKENRPGRPIRTRDAIFMQHGDWKDFTGMHLPGTLSSLVPDAFGIAVYFAENDVDVWGIDQAWTLVPAEETDFTFMADWGIQRQVDDLNIAIGVARISRAITGTGMRKIVLSGYSSGVVTAMGLINAETQRPPGLRHVNGFIPIDLPMRIADSEAALQAFFAGFAASTFDLINSGQYQEDSPLPIFGALAQSDPDGPSPIPDFTGLTNLQAALYLGTAPIFGVIPFHYFAGIWDNGLPAGVEYTSMDNFISFLVNAPPYEPWRFEAEYADLLGQVRDYPFDDHLGEITVPVLNVMPAGGFGRISEYGTTLLGSSDVTQLFIELKPPSEVNFDFGHIDLFTAENAEQLVWQPMLNWIRTHSD